jgi:tetratricopeptide (TPR) repeat protein
VGPRRLGEIIGGSGDLPKARQLLQESLAISRDCNYLLAMAHNFNNLGAVAYWAGDYAKAKEWFIEGKAAFEELGDPGRTAMTISNAGEMCVVLGEDEAAIQYLLEALRIAAARRLPWLPFNTLYALAALLNKQGQPCCLRKLRPRPRREPRCGISMTQWRKFWMKQKDVTSNTTFAMSRAA